MMDRTGAEAFAVRRARSSDMPRLRDVFRRASLSNENDRPHLAKHPEWLELSDDAVRERRTYVAVDRNDAVIGFATYHVTDGVAELSEAFVDPVHMRCGVGRTLVTVICEQVEAMKYESLNVIANTNAVAFYEHMGFAVDRLIDTEGSTAIRMRKPIPQS
jgi:N-acetylglutamate synthase-like GNAT family acetyltransferase